MGKIIEVEQESYQTASSPDELYSGGIGPCIAMGAIYGGRGFMFHTSSVEHYYDETLGSMLKDLRQYSNQNGLQIYVIGGDDSIDEGESDGIDCKSGIVKGRNLVMEGLRDEGLVKFLKTVRWCKPNCVQTLRLILAEGRAEITEDEVHRNKIT